MRPTTSCRRSGRSAAVVTIHDIIHLLYPQFLPNRAAHLYARYMIRRALTRGRPDRHGLPQHAKRPGQLLPGAVLPHRGDLQRRLAAVPPRHPGRGEAARGRGAGHPRALHALPGRREAAQERAERRPGLREGEAGRVPSARRSSSPARCRPTPARTSALISALELGDAAIRPGVVEEEDLPGLYAGADAFLYPTLYEGFGLPVIEAMACGTPVLTSSTSALQEIAGGYACLVNPMDVDAIAEGIVAAGHRREGPREVRRARARARRGLLLGSGGEPDPRGVFRRPCAGLGTRDSGLGSADEDRRRPRLVERDAGRREGPRGDPSARCPTRRSSRSSTCPGSVSAGIEQLPDPRSHLNELPVRADRHYRQYLPLFARAVESFDLSGFDLVVSSSHCVAKGAIAPAGRAAPLLLPHARSLRLRPVRHVLPGRADSLAGLEVALSSAGFATGTSGRPGRPSRYLANSARRRRAHPPPLRPRGGRLPSPGGCRVLPPGRRTPREEFLLAVGSLVPYKRFETAIEAARRIRRPLVIVGRGPEQERLRALADSSVRFLVNLEPEQLRSLYRTCAFFVQPGEEDFGIASVEALACGAPVVALSRGGASDVVRGRGNRHPLRRGGAGGARRGGRTRGGTALRLHSPAGLGVALRLERFRQGVPGGA